MKTLRFIMEINQIGAQRCRTKQQS